LPRPKVANFKKEFIKHSSTKQKGLLEAIRIAKEMYDNGRTSPVHYDIGGCEVVINGDKEDTGRYSC
jgi:hypothetical protein